MALTQSDAIPILVELKKMEERLLEMKESIEKIKKELVD